MSTGIWAAPVMAMLHARSGEEFSAGVKIAAPAGAAPARRYPFFVGETDFPAAGTKKGASIAQYCIPAAPSLAARAHTERLLSTAKNGGELAIVLKRRLQTPKLSKRTPTMFGRPLGSDCF
jgi:hypothetical protein